MKRWDKHPESTHVHWAFCTPGDNLKPPPANIPVVKAFELCGLDRQRSVTERRKETARA
jgi:hypothetical protein